MNKLILKSVKGKIVIENNDKKPVNKSPVDKSPVDKNDNDEITKLLKEIEKLNNTQNNDYPNITNPNYIKRLNYLINLGINLKDYDKDFVYYFVNNPKPNHISCHLFDPNTLLQMLSHIQLFVVYRSVHVRLYVIVSLQG